MEAVKLSSDVTVSVKQSRVSAIADAALFGAISAAQRALIFLAMMAQSLLNHGNELPGCIAKGFPANELHPKGKPVPENKDGSETEDDGEEDDDEDDDNGDDDDDDGGDEDFSGGEEGADDDGDPDANGNENKDEDEDGDDDDDDDDDGGEDDESDEEEEEGEEEDEEDEDQHPAKKRK